MTVEANLKNEIEEPQNVEAQILKTDSKRVGFDKMNKDTPPPNEQLRGDQEWKYGKNGWRKTKKLTEEQKQQKAEKMRDLGKRGAQKTKVYKEQIQKKEEEIKQVKEI